MVQLIPVSYTHLCYGNLGRYAVVFRCAGKYLRQNYLWCSVFIPDLSVQPFLYAGCSGSLQLEGAVQAGKYRAAYAGDYCDGPGRGDGSQ